jgi:16S rRNA C967 or C1407 C5-methylase (RsmB/RsmF family)
MIASKTELKGVRRNQETVLKKTTADIAELHEVQLQLIEAEEE